MSNTLASGNAQTPPPPSDNGQQPPPGDEHLPPDGGDPQADPPPDDGTDPPAGDPPDDAGGKRRRADERIKELADERTAAIEYGNYWREQATAHLQKPPDPPPAAAKTAAPKLSDFPAGDGQFDAIKWSEAVVTWNEQQIDARVEQRLSKADQAREAVTVANSWQGRVDAFAATHPDFAAVTGNPRLPIDKPMADAIQRSELGADIFYHLGKNPHEAARIARGTPQQQREAIIRLEGRVEALRGAPAPKPAARARTAAPPPPTALRPAGGSDVNLETCSIDEFMSARLGSSRKAR